MATPARPITPPSGAQQQQAPTITARQKQAMIDNLQLEITNRARKLRNEFDESSRWLNRRIENRVGRLPSHIRKITIGELFDKYLDGLTAPKAASAPKLPAVILSRYGQTTSPVRQLQATLPASAAKPIQTSPVREFRGAKRSSAEMIGSDKENHTLDLSVQKKRKVDGPASKPIAARGARKINPSTVLSPKSHNSRTLPHSPIRPIPTTTASYAARTVPAKTGATASTMPPPNSKARTARPRVTTKNSDTSSSSVGSLRGRKPAVPKAAAQSTTATMTRTRAGSNSSASSSVSTTTVVNKKGTTAAVKKVGIISKVTGMAAAAGRKAVASKKKTVAAADSGTETRTRALRSRK